MRLGWMWPGFEPTQDQFNASYAQMMKQIVARNAAVGMHTLLDMHQDCFSSLFCLYDGMRTRLQ
jgi:endoglycosylceramidase